MNRKIILIFGRTGSGKSFLTKKIIRNERRLIVIDSMYEYTDGIIFYRLNALIDYLQNNKPATFRFICRFDTELEIELLFLLVWELQNVFLVVEESEYYISPYKKISNFLRLVRYGRHRNISIVAVARRVVELSNDIKFNANQIITFKQILKNDLKYLESLGFDADEVTNLKRYEYKEVTY